MTDTTVCSRCVLDSGIPGLRFDEKGECNYCAIHDALEARYPRGEEGERALTRIVSEIKASGRGREYDCVAGVSGGRDSSYVLLTAARLGLRVLAVHFDNGWNSEIAVKNIQNAVARLGFDLETVVADWEEFRTLQLAFLRASVSDADVPTDVAILGSLHQTAARHGIRHIINGHSFRTEGLMPIGWTYMDGRYVRAILKRFAPDARTPSVPNFTLYHLLRHVIIGGLKTVPILNYVDYDRDAANGILERELGWTYYGGHHHESRYTCFFQSYLLPRKFGIDKRKVEYSALVRSGQMDRDAALREIAETPYPFDEELVAYALKKLRLSREEFEAIMAAPPKSFLDYPTYYPLIQRMRGPIRLAGNLGLLPELLCLKYLN